MKRLLPFLLLLISGIYLPESVLLGQSKSISTLWSLCGAGIGYEHYTPEGDFVQIELKTDVNDIFMASKWDPAASVSFTWNMTIVEHISRNGNTVCFYAGPGAAGGWVKDNNEKSGAIFGIKGRIGVECRFHERHVTLSAGLAPELGMHISFKGETSYMRLYRNGLLHGLLPEIGIKYAF